MDVLLSWFGGRREAAAGAAAGAGRSELETLTELRAGRVREARARSKAVFLAAQALDRRWEAEGGARVSGQFLAECDDAAEALWHPGPRHPMLLRAEERRGAAEAVLDFVVRGGASLTEVMAPGALVTSRPRGRAPRQAEGRGRVRPPGLGLRPGRQLGRQPAEVHHRVHEGLD